MRSHRKLRRICAPVQLCTGLEFKEHQPKATIIENHSLLRNIWIHRERWHRIFIPVPGMTHIYYSGSTICTLMFLSDIYHIWVYTMTFECIFKWNLNPCLQNLSNTYVNPQSGRYNLEMGALHYYFLQLHQKGPTPLLLCPPQRHVEALTLRTLEWELIWI